MLIHKALQRQQGDQQDLINEGMPSWLFEGKLEKVAQRRVLQGGFTEISASSRFRGKTAHYPSKRESSARTLIRPSAKISRSNCAHSVTSWACHNTELIMSSKARSQSAPAQSSTAGADLA